MKTPNYIIKPEKNTLDESIIMNSAYTPAGDYIGSEKTAKLLCEKYGIAPELAEPNNNVCSIGFSEKDQKWYGWSHRAIFGFGIGSECKKGDCAYTPDNPEEMIEEYANWLDGNKSEQRRKECQILEDRSGIRILHSPMLLPMANSLDDAMAVVEGDDIETKLVDIFGGDKAYETRKCGRGAWTATTLEEAKQMAAAFAESVS